jgi:hypothetical protein
MRPLDCFASLAIDGQRIGSLIFGAVIIIIEVYP